jgi:hypothetical protein
MEPESRPEGEQPMTNEWYWRGSVDQQLRNMQGMLREIATCIDVDNRDHREWRENLTGWREEVEEWRVSVDRRLDMAAGGHHPSTDDNNKQFISWEWVRDKLLLPILITGLTLFLFTLVPVIIIVMTVGKPLLDKMLTP